MPSARLFTLCGIAAALLAVPVAIAASPCAPSLPSAPLTLVAALDTALCRAPQTQATWAQAKVQAALLDTAKADRLPTGSANLTKNNNDTDSNHTRLQTASVQLAYTLFDFGQREARIDQAEVADQDWMQLAWLLRHENPDLFIEMLMVLRAKARSFDIEHEGEDQIEDDGKVETRDTDLGKATPAALESDEESAI